MSCRTPACGRCASLETALVERPRAWLLTIVRNTAFTWLAKNRPKTVRADGDPELLEGCGRDRADLPPDPEEALIAAADEAALESAIAALPHIFREVVVMRDINGMSYREIAAAIGSAAGNGDVEARAGARATGREAREPGMTERRSDDPDASPQAALDGELDAAGALDVEGRLAADPALAAEYARLAALRDAIRTRLPRERAPDALRARVIAMAQAHQAAPTAPRRRWRLADALSPLAASLMLGVVLGAGGYGCSVPPVGGRRRSARDRRRLHQRTAFWPDRGYRDIGSPYRQTLVRRQGRGRDDRRRSQGGRLPAGRRAHRRRRADAGRDARLSAPRAPDRAHRDAGRRRGQGAAPTTRDGYSLLEWTDGGRLYPPSPILPPAEIDEFCAAFRHAAAAEREEPPKT